MIKLAPGKDHAVIITRDNNEGHIRFRVPECINVAYPGFIPRGVDMRLGEPWMRRMDRADAITLLYPGQNEDDFKRRPPVWTRGPVTMLKMDTPDEETGVRRASDQEVLTDIRKPGVFRYEGVAVADDSGVTVRAQLTNLSSWDWRDAYVYFCCGLDPFPAFVDHSGRRTLLYTAEGFVRASDTRRRVWGDFRATAQYYEPAGRPMPRTEEGFNFGECGISPQQVVGGIVLRECVDGKETLVVFTRKHRAVFLDISELNNCIHAEPAAGDLARGECASMEGSMRFVEGSASEVADRILAGQLYEIDLPAGPAGE